MAGPAGAGPAGGRAPADRDRDFGGSVRGATAGGRTADRQTASFRYVAVGVARTCLGKVLALHGEAGQPAMLTLRQLRCHDEALPAGLVRICENPVVIAAAADELGRRCPPLVCVGGQPSAAAWRLLDLLAAGGAQFRYHGDFDWGGVRIASAVRRRVRQGQSHWQPWRYDRDAYEAAAAAASAAPAVARLPRLTGEPVTTPWDPSLADAMARRDVRIEEELSLDTLLADLT